jgi:hypothetical protein
MLSSRRLLGASVRPGQAGLRVPAVRLRGLKQRLLVPVQALPQAMLDLETQSVQHLSTADLIQALKELGEQLATGLCLDAISGRIIRTVQTPPTVSLRMERERLCTLQAVRGSNRLLAN